ncbi:MBL fold metallo-hydrolase [Gracilibacillus oryzae]|nr:MBL fold metallo-hydrolase [Gracilibacillus oryzae]
MKKVKHELRTAGSCKQIEKITNTKKPLRSVFFPAHFSIIVHPDHGLILVDTGYAEHFDNAAKKFPYSLYKKVTPITFAQEDSAKAQLEREGFSCEDVAYIIITHFHADHIAGLKDFPNAKFICIKKAYNHIDGKSGWKALMSGFLPDLMPSDFRERVQFIDENYVPGNNANELDRFGTIYDIFSDQSIYAVELPGHACGQIGLFFETEGQKRFLIADAAWDSDAYRYHQPASPLAGLILDSFSSFQTTLEKLHHFHKDHPDVQMIPSHCREFTGGESK